MPKALIPVHILLVEDNAGDIYLVKEAFTKAKVANEIAVAEDGEAAMEYLRDAKTGKNDLPNLILLDLNLPKKGGQEVLEELKNDKVLKLIPVVVVTSSSSEEDILKSYNLHANSYVTKPVDFNQLLKVVNTIEDFWLSVVQLPKVDTRK